MSFLSSPRSRFFCSTLLISLAALPAAAQEASNPVVFTAQDLAQFAPNTALDMIGQLPGFALEVGEERRGLGQGGANVLIDGERLLGKADDIEDELRRLAASDVERIEILDGASLGIPGLSGPVANIVRGGSSFGGAYSYEATVRDDSTPAQFLRGSITLSGGSPALGWNASAQLDQLRQTLAGDEVVFDAVGQRVDLRSDIQRLRGNSPTVSGGLRYDRGDLTANLNARLNWLDFTFSEDSERTDPRGILPDRLRAQERQLFQFTYRLDGDVAFPLGPGDFKLTGRHSGDRVDISPQSVTSFADTTPPSGTFFNRQSLDNETIMRGEYGIDAFGGRWQASVEGALNRLDVENALDILDADGARITLPFPNFLIEEDRAEAALAYQRSLSDTVQLQLSGGAELSRIAQAGDTTDARSFVRPKGFAALSMTPQPGLTLGARIARRVGQLNFFDFVASVDPNNANNDSANPELVPPQSWLFEQTLRWSRADVASISSRLFYEQISDIVDQIPIGASGQAPGNLDSAVRYGMEWEAGIFGDRLGLDGTRLDLALTLQRSRLTDPVTLESRSISDDPRLRLGIDFRHDIAGSSLAYGAGYQLDRNAPVIRLDSIFDEQPSIGLLSVFLEHKDLRGLTVRLTGENLLANSAEGLRQEYLARRDGPIDFIERRRLVEGRIFRLRLEGSF